MTQWHLKDAGYLVPFLEDILPVSLFNTAERGIFLKITKSKIKLFVELAVVGTLERKQK